MFEKKTIKKANCNPVLCKWQQYITGLLLFTLSPFSFASDNQLSTQESASGWHLLFNGKDLSEWRNFNQHDVNANWVIDQGAMHLSKGGGGDLISQKVYENFELKLEWKISTAGNSGIFVLADELGSQIYSHAIEIQILDNERHSDNKISSHLSGSIYDIIPSRKSSHKMAGLWNQVHIVLYNSELTVWQNGVKNAEINIGSNEWNELISQSKFNTWQDFAQAKKGHIGLQDHSDPVWFKNIKIKELKSLMN
ncbi:MAG: hypothetical protein ACI9ES_000953 [Oceanospirillaceae bacterium]|jgi:hypothetical protein